MLPWDICGILVNCGSLVCEFCAFIGTPRAHGNLSEQWVHVYERFGYLFVSWIVAPQVPACQYLHRGKLLSVRGFAMGATPPCCALSYTLRLLTGWLPSQNPLHLEPPPLYYSLKTYVKCLKSQFLLEEIHLQREMNKTPC